MKTSRRFILSVFVCAALFFAGQALAGRFSCENRCSTTPLPACALGCSDFGQPSTCGNAGYACDPGFIGLTSSAADASFALASDAAAENVIDAAAAAAPEAQPAAPEEDPAEALEALRPEGAMTEVASCGPVPGCSFSHIEHSGGVSCCTYLCFGELEPIFCWET